MTNKKGIGLFVTITLFSGGPLQAFDEALFFQQNCVVCHGAKGEGNGRVGKYLKPPAPQIAGKEVSLISTTILSGKRQMPTFQRMLSPEHAKLLAEYVHSLK